VNISLDGVALVLIADPWVLEIPVIENHEALIDLAQLQDIPYGPPPVIRNNSNYTKMRKSVYQKLKQAQALLPDGLRLCLYEGHRSIEVQQKIFQDRYEDLCKLYPNKTHEEIFVESTIFVSPVVNLDGTKNVPPHATGAAVDVYLIDAAGNKVDMGIDLDDTYKDLDASFSVTDSSKISAQAKEYRKIMGAALSAVGFVNYPTEYWHWSYGDRYWAYQTKQSHAIYDVII
jgi:D-alanyl-D-alanine dipeptidase